MLQKGVEKYWEFSPKMLGLGVSNDLVEFEFNEFDLKLNIKSIQILFIRRVIVRYKRVYKFVPKGIKPEYD
jgi:hypothetical protein